MDEVTPNNIPSPPIRPWYKSGGFSVALIVGVIIIVLIVIRLVPQKANAPTALEITLNPHSIRGLATATTDVHTADDPSFGNKDAKVVVVEFGDFQCPFCLQVFPVVRELMQQYNDKVFFQFRDYPIVDLHADALLAAQAGQCAWDQGANKFWAFHDRLFLHQEDLSKAALLTNATAAGLDTSALTSCLDSGKYVNEVNADYADGVAAGARGTPTFFINRERFEGPLTKEDFQTILEKKLKENP